LLFVCALVLVDTTFFMALTPLDMAGAWLGPG
jgi:hypothetical protein